MTHTDADPGALGPYLLLDQIGLGGMAEIWRARKRVASGLSSPVVIKRLRDDLLDRAGMAQMFTDEAHLVAQLRHPNIVQVFDPSTAAEDHYLAMEYVQGRDLQQILARASKRHQRMPHAVAAYLACELLKGLQGAHGAVDERGRPLHIVHRDVSPSNVLISYTGAIKISDFGVARADHLQIRPAPDAQIRAKPGYMSPEQAEGQPLDHRADLFCVGIILYEALAMARLLPTDPEAGPTPADFDVIEGRINNLPGVIPRGLRVILHRALQRDPDQRYPTAAAFLDALRDHLFQMGVTVGSGDMAGYIELIFGSILADERRRQEADDQRLLARIRQRRPAPPPAPREIDSLAPESSLPGTPPDYGGSFTQLDVPRLLYRHSATGAHGRLRLLGRGSYLDVYWRGGRIEHVAGTGPDTRLGALLRQRGHVDQITLDEATAYARLEALPLGEALLRLGHVELSALRPALRDQARARLHQIFRWPEGRYAFFHLDDARAPAPLDLDVWALICDGVRQHIDLSVIRRYVESHSGSTVIRCDHQLLSPATLPLSDHQRQLWALAITGRTVAEVHQRMMEIAEGEGDREARAAAALRALVLFERLDLISFRP